MFIRRHATPPCAIFFNIFSLWLSSLSSFRRAQKKLLDRPSSWNVLSTKMSWKLFSNMQRACLTNWGPDSSCQSRTMISSWECVMNFTFSRSTLHTSSQKVNLSWNYINRCSTGEYHLFVVYFCPFIFICFSLLTRPVFFSSDSFADFFVLLLLLLHD